MNLKNFLPLLAVVLFAGCATPSFTRVTPTAQPRNANNLYPVEVIFDSQQQSLRWNSVKAFVMVNGEVLPLHKVPLVENRWEGLIPMPASANSVNYRFKFDFLYNSFGKPPQANSVTSKVYTLRILDQ